MTFSSKSSSNEPWRLTSSHEKDACLEQVYQQIGNQRDRLMAEVNLALLDLSSSLDMDMILRLALTTAFQYAEGLPDAVASDATVHRADWRKALYLPTNQPGIFAVSLCQFRELLNHSFVALQEYTQLLNYLERIGYFACFAKETPDAANLIMAVCSITRFYHLKQAMKTALGRLITAHPSFLRSHSLPHWYHRYHTSQLTLSGMAVVDNIPEEAVRLGKDIQHLLTTLEDQGLDEIKKQAELQYLDRLFKNNFMVTTCQMTWRQPVCTICPNSKMGTAHSQSPPAHEPR